jgi:hypothetical protein
MQGSRTGKNIMRKFLKPAATLGFGPSSVREYGEPARWTGRVLLSSDPYSFSSYSACGACNWSLYNYSGFGSLTDATVPAS